jgi:hypothetical protein
MNIQTVLVDIANEVMNQLGAGYTKEVYQRAFYVSLKHKNIRCENKDVSIVYENEMIGVLTSDVVHESIVLLIDVGDTLNLNDYITKGTNYMKHSRLPYGMICLFPSSQNRLVIQHI